MQARDKKLPSGLRRSYATPVHRFSKGCCCCCPLHSTSSSLLRAATLNQYTISHGQILRPPDCSRQPPFTHSFGVFVNLAGSSSFTLKGGICCGGPRLVPNKGFYLRRVGQEADWAKARSKPGLSERFPDLVLRVHPRPCAAATPAILIREG